MKHRTAVVNQVRGLLLEYGIVIPQGIARLRKRLPRVLEEADNGLSFLMRDLLQSLQSELSALDTRLTLPPSRVSSRASATRERRVNACKRWRALGP